MKYKIIDGDREEAIVRLGTIIERFPPSQKVGGFLDYLKLQSHHY
ncbi:hypothetical protein GM3709_1648 [Geminocystis sp. NIES-3709]|nr:hypothetical protein GM3709_1648 [Geminocystis sp. NIES-3709]